MEHHYTWCEISFDELQLQVIRNHYNDIKSFDFLIVSVYSRGSKS